MKYCTLITIVILGFSLFTSCEKEPVNELGNQKLISSTINSKTPITVISEIEGTWKLDAIKKTGEEWQTANSVGLGFFGDTYLYGVNLLSFSEDEVELLVSSSYSDIPVSFGNYRAGADASGILSIINWWSNLAWTYSTDLDDTGTILILRSLGNEIGAHRFLKTN